MVINYGGIDMSRLTKKVGENYCSQNGDFYDLDNKLGKLEDLEEKYGCSFEILDKLIDQNQLYYQFFDELQHWTSIKVDLRKKVVWYCKQVGGHYACSQPLSNYGKTFWLKKDKSE